METVSNLRARFFYLSRKGHCWRQLCAAPRIAPRIGTIHRWSPMTRETPTRPSVEQLD